VYAKLCFDRVLKRFLSAHLMRVKLLLFAFYSNGGLRAVFIGKPSEWMSNFWTVQLFNNRIRNKFRFSAHPYMSDDTMSTNFHVLTTLLVTYNLYKTYLGLQLVLADLSISLILS